MNEMLKEYLRENETVRWESRTQAFSTLDGKYGKKFLVRVVAAVLVAAGIIVGHMASGTDPKMGLIALVILAVVAVAAAPFLERMRLMKAKYWITDQRVIMLGSDKLMRSMDLEAIDAFKVMADGSAKNCLVLGSVVFKDTEKSMRWRAGTPKTPEDAGSSREHALGMILYNAEHVGEAVALLKTLGCAQVA